MTGKWLWAPYQLAGTGHIAEASLSGGAKESVTAVNASRGDGRKSVGATKESDSENKKNGGLHFECSEYSIQRSGCVSYFGVRVSLIVPACGQESSSIAIVLRFSTTQASFDRSSGLLL